jgi:hypothetical protein
MQKMTCTLQCRHDTNEKPAAAATHYLVLMLVPQDRTFKNVSIYFAGISILQSRPPASHGLRGQRRPKCGVFSRNEKMLDLLFIF